jgi:MFS family permease
VLILVSTGVGAPASAAAFDLAREANRPERGGAATGVVNLGGFSAAVLTDLAIGGLLAAVGHSGHRPSGFEWPMACIPVMVAVGTTGFWWCGRHASRRSVPAPLPVA